MSNRTNTNRIIQDLIHTLNIYDDNINNIYTILSNINNERRHINRSINHYLNTLDSNDFQENENNYSTNSILSNNIFNRDISNDILDGNGLNNDNLDNDNLDNNNINENINIIDTFSNNFIHLLETYYLPVMVRPSDRQIELSTRKLLYKDIIDPVNESCPISMENFNPNDNVTQILYCGHIFKTGLLNYWFREHVICPICRYDIRNYNN